MIPYEFIVRIKMCYCNNDLIIEIVVILLVCIQVYKNIAFFVV
jgi:hypothetical protein